MTIVPKGKDFLPKYSKQNIVDLYRKEKNAKAKIRPLAAVFRKENMALKEISEKINYPFTTIGDWLRRMHLEGISRNDTA
jgi:predicted transcriptional regulator